VGLNVWKILFLSLLAVGGYALAFSIPAGAAGILVALPSIFLLARVRTPRQAFYGGLLLGVASAYQQKTAGDQH
jgi:hypothetical protein